MLYTLKSSEWLDAIKMVGHVQHLFRVGERVQSVTLLMGLKVPKPVAFLLASDRVILCPDHEAKTVTFKTS